MSGEPSPCLDCGHLILVMQEAYTGQVVPLDPEPSPRGTYVVSEGFAHNVGNDAELAAPGKPVYARHSCK